MIYTVSVHEEQEREFEKEMKNSEDFEIIERLQFGAFQVDGPDNSLFELRSLESVYAANRDGPIRFGDN